MKRSTSPIYIFFVTPSSARKDASRLAAAGVIVCAAAFSASASRARILRRSFCSSLTPMHAVAPPPPNPFNPFNSALDDALAASSAAAVAKDAGWFNRSLAMPVRAGTLKPWHFIVPARSAAFRLICFCLVEQLPFPIRRADLMRSSDGWSAGHSHAKWAT